MDPIFLVEAAINGILLGGVLALLALGLNLILGVLDIVVHLLIISPILTSSPINQLLATCGLLFFLQSAATFLWTTDHRTVRLSLPSFEIAGIFLPATRIIPFVISIVAVIALYV